VTSTETDVLTPTIRAWWRRGRFWVGATGLLIAIALVTLVVRGAGGDGAALDPENPAPIGAKALAETLRGQGIEVLTTTRDEEVAALTDAATTLLIDDWLGVLGPDALDALAALGAEHVVLLDPTAAALDAFLPGVRRAGVTEDPAPAPGCAFAADLGAVTGRATLFDLGDRAGVAGCYPNGAGLVRLATDGSTTAFGAGAAMSNEHITEESNAALALRVLGTSARLVWYRPDAAEAEIPAPPTIGDLSPGWVVPGALLLVATFVAAAVWRGRRMGPLVVEPLPSIVRADETVRGRARMYARGRARLRALDALRIGTLERAASALGLPRGADVETIVRGIAAVTGASAADLLRLLRDETPAGDADLLRLSTELLRLEDELGRRTRPETGE